MKLRCAYCKKLFEFDGSKPPSHCPHCGRVVVFPGQLKEVRDQKKKPFQRRHRILDDDGSGEPATFLEMLMARKPMVVMLMLGIMVLVGGITLGRLTLQSRGTPIMQRRAYTTQRELTALRIALERFRTDCGRYPTEAEGLKGLLNNPGGVAGWDGFYITLLRSDPWRNAYVYRLRDGAPVLLSAGPDGEAGTADDVQPEPLSQEAIASYLVKTNGGWQSPAANPAGVGIQR